MPSSPEPAPFARPTHQQRESSRRVLPGHRIPNLRLGSGLSNFSHGGGKEKKKKAPVTTLTCGPRNMTGLESKSRDLHSIPQVAGPYSPTQHPDQITSISIKIHVETLQPYPSYRFSTMINALNFSGNSSSSTNPSCTQSPQNRYARSCE